MGFFDNIFSSFAMSTYKGICRAMINSYKAVKKQNPNVSKRELYALALSLRPTYQRINPSSFTFKKGGRELTIEEKDAFRDVVMRVIIIETDPLDMREVVGAMIEGFKDFKE